MDNHVSHDDKLFGAISYLWFLSILIFVLKRDSEFVQFHAKQGSVLFVLMVIAWMIPVFGIFANIAFFILMISGLLQAYMGNRWRMPLVGTIIEKIHW